MQYAELVRSAAMIATGVLGWAPADFWRATPAELQLALDGRFGVAAPALGRAELERLQENLGDG